MAYKVFGFLEEEVGVPIFGFLIGLLIVILYLLLRLAPDLLKEVSFVMWVLYPIWLPPLLLYIFLVVWMIYVRADFLFKQSYTLLEIKLPRELPKSPLAMESVFSGLHQGAGEGTWFDRNFLGKVRTSFSMEIVSIGGQVKFFIRTRSFWKEIIEAQIYAQYPEVEIVEAEDYTRMINPDLKEKGIWGADFKLKKSDAYPIKTYIDYGLDKDQKEELKVDPMSPLIEFFGGIGRGEQLWLQFLIRVNKDEKTKPAKPILGFIPPPFSFGKIGWKDEAQDVINDLMLRDPKTKSARELTSAGFEISPRLSKGEQETISSIERSLTKLAFDVGIRGIYVADKDKFRPVNIAGLLGTVKQFNSGTLNQFVPTRYLTEFSYPWHDYKGILQDRQRRKVFDAYRRRSYFFHPYKTQPFVLTTEELATIYHFPGSVTKTPTIARVPSKKSEAPSNLPI